MNQEELSNTVKQLKLEDELESKSIMEDTVISQWFQTSQFSHTWTIKK